MERSNFWIILAVLAVVIVFVLSVRRNAVADPDEIRLGTKWEYKQLANPTEEQMNKVGEEGWELVHVTGGEPYVKSFVTAPVAMGQGTKTDNTVEYAKTTYTFRRLVFKKP